MRKKIRSIFVGGKAIGYNALKILIKRNNFPIFVIGNLDDYSKDNQWHNSTIKLAKKNKIKILNLKQLSKKITEKKLENIDIIFCIGSTQILPSQVIKLPRLGSLNIHPSLLPKYRGRYSTVHAIFNGDKITGVTAHWISEKIDAGNIISKKVIKIKPHYTAKDLYNEFTKKGIKLFIEIYTKIQNNERIKSYKINKLKMKYNRKSLPNNGKINWNWKGKKIFNFIRSMTFEPFAPPSFYIGKRKYLILPEDQIKKIKFIRSPK